MNEELSGPMLKKIVAEYNENKPKDE